MFEDPDVCEPKDGLYREGHEECEKCHISCRRLCQYYSMKNDFKEPDDYKRKRKLDTAIEEVLNEQEEPEDK